MTRRKLLGRAVEECIKELYTYVQPKINWEEFVEENRKYNEQYTFWDNFTTALQNKDKEPKIWEQYKANFPNWENKSMNECIGPKPFEFYYLPKEIMKDICNSYIYAYKLDEQQELLNIIEILKNYCQEPIIEKYIEGKNGEPGYRGYEHPNNLEKEIKKIIKPAENISLDKKESYDKSYNKLIEDVHNKFFEFLDMAGKFYNWTSELNAFNMSVYLGPSPSSNKEAVIENWKKYRNKDIEINEEQIKKDYYGEEN